MNREEVLRELKKAEGHLLEALQAGDREEAKRLAKEVVQIAEVLKLDLEGFVMTLYAYGYSTEEVDEILGGE